MKTESVEDIVKKITAEHGKDHVLRQRSENHDKWRNHETDSKRMGDSEAYQFATAETLLDLIRDYVLQYNGSLDLDVKTEKRVYSSLKEYYFSSNAEGN